MNIFERSTISIDWDFGLPPPVIRCPMTGEIVLAGFDPATGDYEDGVDEPDHTKIPTATFYYLDEIGEFVFIRDDLQQAIVEYRKTLSEDDSDDISDFDILSEGHISLGRIPLIFALTTHGISHGPVSSTAWVGLDLAGVAQSAE